jgi:hypothetical protein
MQKEIAEQAEKQNLPDAAERAAAAAEALQKMDLGAAVQEQQKALEKLQEAAKQAQAGEPMEGEPMSVNHAGPADEG